MDFIKEIFQIDKTQYKKFSNFKARILEPARKELEEKYKNFHFKYNKIKVARKIVSIKFLIIEDEILKITKPCYNLVDNEISKWIPSEKIIN